MILRGAAGETNTLVAHELRLTKQTVGKWRTRFLSRRLDGLLNELRRHIEDAVKLEWPAMAQRRATLTPIPAPLAEALREAVSLAPQEDGQRIAQREIVTMLQDALDARRQRIIISQSGPGTIGICVDDAQWWPMNLSRSEN